MPEWVTNFTYKIENRAAKAGAVYSLASRYYEDIVKKEVVLAGINKNDHVLCIGGGICPFSALLIHKETGAKVTVIDKNSSCIKKAKQVIKRLGMEKHVRLLHKDGESLEKLENYTVIHFAMQVSPLETVFLQVAREAIPGTRLLVRRPKSSVKKLYHGNLEAFNKFPYVCHKGLCNVGSTLLYTKSDCA